MNDEGTYRRDLKCTRLRGGLSILHNGVDFAESPVSPAKALRSLDAEIATLKLRMMDLESARAAVVKHTRKTIA